MLQIPVVQNIVNIIIDHQRAIIGPLALEQASRVPGVKIAGGEHVEVEAGINPQSLLNQLVKQYENKVDIFEFRADLLDVEELNLSGKLPEQTKKKMKLFLELQKIIQKQL